MEDKRRSLQAVVWGGLIRRARLSEYLTQQRFADAIVEAARNDGIELTLDQPAVSAWENGNAEPALRYRKYIATVLAVEPSVLFCEIHEKAVA